MSKLIALVISALVITTFGFSPYQSANELNNLVKGYLEAHNSHNIDAVMALYSDNIKYIEEGISERSGKSVLRSKEEWDAAVNATLEVTQMKVSGNTVTGKATEFSDWYEAADISEVHYDSITFKFEGNLISEITVVYSEETNTLIGRVFLSFLNWTSYFHADDLKKLKPEGTFIYTPDLAPLWLKLLKEWHASGEPY